MKECISEKDHYRTFPEKGYQLDEECDLIDVQGDEKHPELFGDLEPAQPHAPSIPTGNAPLSLGKVALGQTFSGPGSGPRPPAAAFGAPRLTPPAIVPVNDPRFSPPVPSNTNTETESKSQLPSRPELGSHQSETESNQAVANVPDISITTDEMPKTLDNGDFLNIPIPPVSRVSQGEFVGTIGANKPGPPNTISSAPAGLTSLDKVKKGTVLLY
uniref:SH3 domain-containing protein n=1 Tax=Heterorhabditis bacteriophora TaxID=37862 RepID=A0A1I7XTM4_HETBA